MPSEVDDIRMYGMREEQYGDIPKVVFDRSVAYFEKHGP
jgi:hypothetical protein